MKYSITVYLWMCLLLSWIGPTITLAQSQTYIVSTADDVVDAQDGLLSLREAILAANANEADGDAIQFNNTLSGQTIFLNLGELVIEDDIIIGDDSSPVFINIDAAGTSRIFSVSTLSATGSRSVTLSDIAFLNGMETNGGALYIGAEEDVLCIRCRFDGNTATGDSPGQGGGAIYTEGTLALLDTDLLNNMATTGSGNGGGILIAPTGALTMSAGTVEGNVANRAGGGVENNGGSAAFSDVLFTTNSAGRDAASAAPGNGGAIHVSGMGTTSITGGAAVGNFAFSEGGAFWNGSGTMTIENTQIGGPDMNDGNTASGADADNGGGGLFNAGGTLMVLNAWIEGNVADGASGSGGGVLNDGGSVQMERTMVKGNRANRAGGGMESNGLPDANGRIRATTDFLQFVTLQDNIAGTAPGNGGGFHQTGPGNVSFVQSLAVGNKAGNEGGGLWNSGIGSMRLLNSTVSGNSAPMGGGVFQQAGGNSSLRFWLSTIVRNTATESGGGVQSNDDMPVFFNSILAENVTNLTISNCAGAFSSIGRNLFENLDGCTLIPEPDDIVGQPALIVDLADNGGPTWTHALLSGSPAIDAGMCIPSIMEDQRGTRRVFPCDMGSFETDGRPAINSGITFTLMDASTDSPIAGFDPIANGMNIVQSDLPDAVNIRANIEGNPGSVVFDFNGSNATRTENVAPYALFGDLAGDFLPGVLYEGLQTLTARPFSLTDGEGQMMTPQNISFSVVGSKNVITRLVLVDADTDQDVMILEDGITISDNELPANLNVRADAGSATRRVTFAVGGQSRSEVAPPYALFGDISGDYLNGSVPPGMYELEITPYDASGKEGVKMVLRATVTDGAANSNTGSKAKARTMILPADEEAMLSGKSADVPEEFTLHKNYPNPFNPTTVISYSVPQAAEVELVIYNVLGQRIQTLVSGTVQAGTHQVNMDATSLPSGIYLYRLITPMGALTRKMILTR